MVAMGLTGFNRDGDGVLAANYGYFERHRHTRSNAQGPLHQLTNDELARLERQNRQQPRTIDTNMGDHGNMDDLTVALALIQQQMQTQQHNVRNNQQLFWPKQDKPTDPAQSNQADTPAVERNTEPAVGTSSPGPEQPAEAVRPIPEVVPPREYIPKVPYPVPAKATLRAEAEQSAVNIDADGYAKTLDSARSMGRMPIPRQLRGIQNQQLEQVRQDQNKAVRPIPEVVPPREYIPKVPYPVPAKATRKDREEMKCRKMLEDLTVRLPLMDAIQMMPSMRNFMKGLISGKISEESEFLTVSKECLIPQGVWEEW
ncbi:hypothetical protein DY000_02034299 [Brassica cretica]|uniref:Uncharacterized protein n=1 Tax=Brassica cretica TaxID=69181 RepID=A0ABQ7DZF6_BRACR|nr:hypothetical protein DY000_02034299 [Brassica cretica]